MALAAAVSLGPMFARGKAARVGWGWVLVGLAGYAVFEGTRAYREQERAGSVGFTELPDRLLTSGPYAVTRNPMYVGQLTFLACLVLATGSPIAALLLVGRALRLGAQVQLDEERLAERFGDEYRVYLARVPRWIPNPARDVR